MAPPRRARGEFLVWRRPGEPDRELFKNTVTQWLGEQPTQRQFQVSADARCLAYTDPQTRYLHLLRRGGERLAIAHVAGNDVRFSPSGAELAVVSRNYAENRASQVELVDIKRLSRTTLALWNDPAWFEFCHAGLVVLHRNSSNSASQLTLLARDGSSRELLDEIATIQRFTLGRDSNSIVYFDKSDVCYLSLDGSGRGRRVSLGALYGDQGPVRNAEMSPDGEQLLFATDSALYLASGGGEPTVLTRGERVHSLWFSKDGTAFAWASDRRAVWQKDGEPRELLAGESASIEALRFCQASPGLIVCRGNEVVFWRPEENQKDVLTQMDAGKTVIGADLFYGGMVIWAVEPWEYSGRRGAKELNFD